MFLVVVFRWFWIFLVGSDGVYRWFCFFLVVVFRRCFCVDSSVLGYSGGSSGSG